MKRIKRKNITQARRQNRIRGKIKGSGTHPRLSVFRSNKNLYVQIIDDVARKTLASGMLKDIKAAKSETLGARAAKAFELGKAIAEKAKKAGVSEVIFDRGSYAYHGRVKALADGAREGGLKF